MPIDYKKYPKNWKTEIRPTVLKRAGNKCEFCGLSNEVTNPASCQTAVSGSYYLVRYYGGSYDDYYSTVIFVTNKKSTATKYCTKFNKLLKKWKTYYAQFETNKYGITWLADEHVEKHFNRWNSLKNITKCYYEEVSFR